MGYKVDFECKLRWAQNLIEPFMGDDGTPADKLEKIKASQGWYEVVLVMDDQTKEFLLDKGATQKGLHGHNWGTTPEGDITWRVRRPHVNPKLKDENGDPLFYGAPKVYIDNGDGTKREYNLEEDGLIGNDSEAKVRMDFYTKNGKSIYTLEAVKLTGLVVYEGGEAESLEEF